MTEPESRLGTDDFQTVIDYQREQIRLACNPLLMPYVAPGHVFTPQEQYIRRLRSLGYGV